MKSMCLMGGSGDKMGDVRKLFLNLSSSSPTAYQTLHSSLANPEWVAISLELKELNSEF